MKKFLIILFSLLLTVVATLGITSCSNVFVDNVVPSSENEGKVGNAELKLLVPDYYVLANEGRVIAPQTVNIRLSVKNVTDFVEHSVVALPTNGSDKIEGAPVDFPASLYTIKFSDIPIKKYAKGELKIELLDKNNNVISSGANETEVNITLGGTSNVTFYTIPVSYVSDSDCLDKGQMKFFKKTLMAGKTYTIKPIVKEGESFPDLVLFNEKGSYLQYCSINDKTNALTITPETDIDRFIGIWADEGAISNYTLDIQYSGSLKGAIDYTTFNNIGFGEGTTFDSTWNNTNSSVITLNNKEVTFDHKTSSANNQSLTRDIILNDDSLLKFDVQTDLYKEYDGSVDFYIDDVLVDSYTGQASETIQQQCKYEIKEGKHTIKWIINDTEPGATSKITNSCKISNLQLEKLNISYDLNDGFGSAGKFATGWILNGDIKPSLVSNSMHTDAVEFAFKLMGDNMISELSKTIAVKSPSKLSFIISTNISDQVDGYVEFYIDNKKQESYTGIQNDSKEVFFIENGKHNISWKFIGKDSQQYSGPANVIIKTLILSELKSEQFSNENFESGTLSDYISGSGRVTTDAVFAKWKENTTRAPNVINDNHGNLYELQNNQKLVISNVNATVPSCLSFDYKSDLFDSNAVKIYVDDEIMPIGLGGYGTKWLKHSVPLASGLHTIKILNSSKSMSEQLANVFYIDNITLAEDVTEKVDIYPKGKQETYVSGTPIQFSAKALRKDGSVRDNVDVFFSVNGGKITRDGLYTPPKKAGTYTVTAHIDGKVASNTSVIVHGENYLSEPVTIAGKTFNGGNETSADGFFVLKGYSDTPLYIEVIKSGTQYKTYYLIRKPGYYEKRIWLRFGKGQYDITAWRAKNLVIRDTQDPKYEGDFYSTGEMYVDRTFTVTNISDAFTTEEALWLMPSEVVQSDSFFVSNVVNAVLAELPANASIGDKLRALHDWELYNHHYDKVSLNHEERRKRQDAEAVIKYGLCVCEGYANLYAALLRNMGVQAKVITSEPLNHAWNHVLYNNSWYLVDVTWDDPVPSGAGDEYCDKSPNREIYSYFMTAHTDSGHTDQGIPDQSRSIIQQEELPYMRGMPNGWY